MDVLTHQCTQTLKGHNLFTLVAWSCNGKRICSGYKRLMEVWEVSSGECIQTLEDPYNVFAVAWNSDGTRICGAGWRQRRDSDDRIETIRVWEVSSGRCIQILRPQSEVLSLSWSRDKIYSIGRGRSFLGGEPFTVQMWEITSSRCQTRKLDCGMDFFDFEKVSWSSDCSEFCCAIKWKDLMEVWNVSGESICTLGRYMNSSAISAISWSRDDTRICNGTERGTIQVWEVPSGQCIQTFECLGNVLSLSWNRDG